MRWMTSIWRGPYSRWPLGVRCGLIRPCRRSHARSVTELTPVRCDTVRIGKSSPDSAEGRGFGRGMARRVSYTTLVHHKDFETSTESSGVLFLYKICTF